MIMLAVDDAILYVVSAAGAVCLSAMQCSATPMCVIASYTEASVPTERNARNARLPVNYVRAANSLSTVVQLQFIWTQSLLQIAWNFFKLAHK